MTGEPATIDTNAAVHAIEAEETAHLPMELRADGTQVINLMPLAPLPATCAP